MIWTVALKSEIFDRLNEDEFVDFCLANTHLQIERTAEGEILIDSPNYSKTGEKSGELFYQLTAWNKKK
jgi:Uma2 family endonuclease